MAAIDREGTKIYIAPAGTAGSDLADSDLFRGEITEVNSSGAEREQETTNAFGGDITRTQPRSEIELEMEVTPAQDGEVDWVGFFFGEDGTNTDYYTSAKAPEDKAVYVEATDGNTTTTHAWNNLQAVTEEMDHPADDTRTISITFNTAPTTQEGKPNYAFTNGDAQSFAGWDSFEA